MYHYPNTGALTVAACASNGDLHTWLDANASPNPITTPLRSSQGSLDSSIVAFSASAVNGPDAPGFVAAASFSDGSLAMASAARGRVSSTFLKDPAASPVVPRGLFSALNDAVGVQEEQSWMHALMGGEGRWWLQRAIGSFVGATQRDHASGSPCRHLWLQHSVRILLASLQYQHIREPSTSSEHIPALSSVLIATGHECSQPSLSTLAHEAEVVQGGVAWVVLALTDSSLDCWRVSHMGGTRDVSTQCMWSYALGAALARFDRRTADAGALMPLRLQVQGDAVCVLCAIKERRNRNRPGDCWSPALALLKLPPVNSSGVWGRQPNRFVRPYLLAPEISHTASHAPVPVPLPGLCRLASPGCHELPAVAYIDQCATRITGFCALPHTGPLRCMHGTGMTLGCVVCWSAIRGLLTSRCFAGTVPDCHFFKKLDYAIPDTGVMQHSRQFSLCMRPDAATVSATDASAILITLLCPRYDGNGALLPPTHTAQDRCHRSHTRIRGCCPQA